MIAVVSAYGSIRLGIGPTQGNLVRILAFYRRRRRLHRALAGTVAPASRRAATAALAAIAIWLVLTLFAGLIAGVVADSFRDVPPDATTEDVLANARLELNVRRLSPDQLYKEATGVLLNPARQSTGILVVDQGDRALPSTLPLDQSLILAWWQLISLVAGTVVLFAAAYVTFMRQEVRA